MGKRNLVEAINLGLREEMERDPTVVILGEDVGREGGVFRVTEGLQEGDIVITNPDIAGLKDNARIKVFFTEK